jgi:hypothetical protein
VSPLQTKVQTPASRIGTITEFSLHAMTAQLARTTERPVRFPARLPMASAARASVPRCPAAMLFCSQSADTDTFPATRQSAKRAAKQTRVYIDLDQHAGKCKLCEQARFAAQTRWFAVISARCRLSHRTRVRQNGAQCFKLKIKGLRYGLYNRS